MRVPFLLTSFTLAIISNSSWAIDRIDFNVGGITRPVIHDTPVINSFRLGLSWDTDYFQSESKNYSRSMRFETSIGLNRTDYGEVKDVAVAPVLHYQSKKSPLFAEFSIGATYLSEEHWNPYHDLGSRLLFADRIGVGYNFEHAEVSANFYHISNANLADKNPGADMLLLRMSFKL